MEGWYSTVAVSRVTGISDRTLRNWCIAKRIPAVKIGRDWHINMRELVTQRGDLGDFWMDVRANLIGIGGNEGNGGNEMGASSEIQDVAEQDK